MTTVALALNDLKEVERTSTHLAIGLAPGKTLVGGVTAPEANNLFVGVGVCAAAAAAAATEPGGTLGADSTIIGGAVPPAALGTPGCVVLCNGAGGAALAAVPAAGATWIGPGTAQDLFDVANVDAAANTTVVGGTPRDADAPLALRPGAVVLADGAGAAVLAADAEQRSVLAGPGCGKRLFSAIAADRVPPRTVCLGDARRLAEEAAAAGGVDDGVGSGCVLVTDTAGTAALAARPGRGSVWLGPGAHKLFAAAAAANATFVGDVPAAAASSANAGGGAGAVVIADGLGGVRLRAYGRTVELKPAAAMGSTPTADGCVLVGATAGAGAADELAIADGAGRLAVFSDARGNTAFGTGTACADLMAVAHAVANHTVVGSVAPAATAAAAAGALAVSDGRERLALYADATGCAWMGPTTAPYFGTALPPAGVWIGGIAAPANLAVNGLFTADEGVAIPDYAYGAPIGWTEVRVPPDTTGGGVVRIADGSASWGRVVHPNGHRFTGLQGDTSGRMAVEQVVHGFVVADRYTITFYAAARTFNVNTVLTVTLDGVPVPLRKTADPEGTNPVEVLTLVSGTDPVTDPSIAAQYIGSFAATRAHHTVRFTDVTGPGQTSLIGDVIVAPESAPETPPTPAPFTLADVSTGAVRWQCDAAGHVHWSAPAGVAAPLTADGASLTIDVTEDDAAGGVWEAAVRVHDGYVCPLGTLTPL